MSRVLPILFNTDMVRAILDGRKTVTRRKIDVDMANNCDIDTDGTLLDYQNEYGDFINPVKLCRYQSGDTLYVREAFCPNYFDESIAGYRGDGLRGNRNAYKADYRKDVVGDVVPEPKWHPSIHMPKEAARIWLKVTDVRVERLQHIDDDGVVAEGLQIGDPFDELWDSTIKKKDRGNYGWDANPWVWVIEFERCQKPESEG